MTAQLMRGQASVETAACGWPGREDVQVKTFGPGEIVSLPVILCDIRNFDGSVGGGTYSLEAVFLYESIDGFPEPGQSMLARSRPIRVKVRPWAMKLAKK